MPGSDQHPVFALESARFRPARCTERGVDGGIVRQLLDQEADPEETTDLAERLDYAVRIAEFHRQLTAQRQNAARQQTK